MLYGGTHHRALPRYQENDPDAFTVAAQTLLRRYKPFITLICNLSVLGAENYLLIATQVTKFGFIIVTFRCKA